MTKVRIVSEKNKGWRPIVMNVRKDPALMQKLVDQYFDCD